MGKFLIFADGWLDFIVPIVFFVLYGVGQLMMAGRDAGKKPAPAKPKPAKADGPPRRQAAPADDPLRGEVEEFLRRVQGKEPRPQTKSEVRRDEQRRSEQRRIEQRRAEQQRVEQQRAEQRHAEQHRPDRQLAGDTGELQTSRPLRSERPRRTPERRTREEVAQEDLVVPVPVPVGRRRREVATSDWNPVAAGDIRQQAPLERDSRTHRDVEPDPFSQHLAVEVSLSDERLEAHLKERFEHRLGSLEHQEIVALEKAGNVAAAEVLQLLRSPAGVRQLMIAGEILRRPEL